MPHRDALVFQFSGAAVENPVSLNSDASRFPVLQYLENRAYRRISWEEDQPKQLCAAA